MCISSGVFEIALAWRGNTYRTVYAVQLGSDIWIVHAFQKKSKTGIKTPKQEIDLINERLKRLSWLVHNYQSTGKLLLYADVLLVVVLVITLILIKRKIVSDIKRLKELSKWKWLLSSP